MIQVRQRDDAGMRKGRDHAQQFQMMLNVPIVRHLRTVSAGWRGEIKSCQANPSRDP